MTADPLALLLAGRYPDPDTGELLGTSVRAVEIEDSLDGREVELLDALGVGTYLAIISDPDTSAALGARVERALASRFRIQRLMIGRHPHADDDTAARLAAELDPAVDAVVSVGSGTITDLGKVVAFRRPCPHVVFATAPSMNGFTSVSASITSGGMKRSIRVAAPTAVYFDLGVLAAAPPRLIRAGLGDSVCRSTAQTDWLLAHLLLEQRYRAAPFALLAGDEPGLLAESAALLAGDRAALRRLARTLVLSGFGMTLCGGSYPASQGEHLISHYLDATGGAGGALHGEQIGVATVTMAALQHAVLAADRPPRLAASRVTHDDVVRHFGPALGDACWLELAPKLLDDARAEQLTARLADCWDAMRARLAAVSAGPDVLRAALAAAGAPVAPADLGIDDVRYADAIRHARAMRNRYTFLDLIGDSQPGGER